MTGRARLERFRAKHPDSPAASFMGTQSPWRPGADRCCQVNRAKSKAALPCLKGVVRLMPQLVLSVEFNSIWAT